VRKTMLLVLVMILFLSVFVQAQQPEETKKHKVLKTIPTVLVCILFLPLCVVALMPDPTMARDPKITEVPNTSHIPSNVGSLLGEIIPPPAPPASKEKP